MKRFRYLCLVALLTACLSLAVNAFERVQWRSPDDTYTLYLTEMKDGTLRVDGYGMAASDAGLGDLIIPAEIDGKTVTSINERAFYRVTSFTGALTLPEGLVSIGEGAFQNCSKLSGQLVLPSTLTEIGVKAFCDCGAFTGDLVIPGGVKEIKAETFSHFGDGAGAIVFEEGVEHIGYRAFAQSGFTGTLTLPSTLKTVEEQAFYYCSGLTGELILPDGLTTLGASAFPCPNLTGTLTVPGTLKEIPEYAFSSTGFTALVLKDGIERIGDSAFSGCEKLTGDLRIPDSVTDIGYRAFYACKGLNGTLTLPSGLKNLGNSAFEECTGMTGELTLPTGLETLGGYAFANTTFTGSLTVPGVKEIGSYAFSDCKGFTSLTLSEGTEHIGECAFEKCTGLTSLSALPSTLKSVGKDAFYNNRALTGSLIFPEGMETIGDYAFGYCESMAGELKLATTITSIGNGAFRSCNALTGDVAFGPGLTKIGEQAFRECKALNGALIFPESVENGATIGDYAFYECGKLTTPDGVKIPEGVVSIGANAFDDCASLSGSLYLPDSIETIGKNAFSSCYKISGELRLPAELKEIPANAFNSCHFTGELELPEGLTSIGESAFWGCNGFTGDLVIPETVTSIGRAAFYYAFGVEGGGELYLPAGLTSIAPETFEECSGLTGTLCIPDSVTTIGYNAFWECSGFTGLELPENLTSLGIGAFYYCTGMKSTLELPEGITTIPDKAFGGCSFTGELELSDDITFIGHEAFSSCQFTGKLKLPKGITEISYGAFTSCSGFTGALTIPEGVTTVGRWAFEGCTGFSELNLPDSLTKIKEEAFNGCSGLKGTLYLPDGLSEIEGYAFMDCTGLTGNLDIPAGVAKLGQWVFKGCTGLDGYVKIPYAVSGITYSSRFFAGCENITAVYYPTVLKNPGNLFEDCKKITDIYYGGTQEQWPTRMPNGLPQTATVHYESYPAQGLEISGGSTISYHVDQTFTLEAVYHNSKPQTDLTFTWSSGSPDVILLESTTEKIPANGYTGRTWATFQALKEGTSTVTVSGGGLSDSATVLATDYKSITFQPQAGQSAELPVAIPVGETVTVQFDYKTSGDAYSEMDSIQWSVASDCVTISDIQNVADSSRSATLKAKITGVTACDPVTITVSGPGNSEGTCQVVVLEDKLTILTEDQAKPAEGEFADYASPTGEEFVIYLRYESPAEAEVVKEKLDHMTWVQSTEDFMIHPDDRSSTDANPVERHSNQAKPLSVTWEATGENTYLVKATFAPAKEGVCSMMATVGQYTNHACLVQSAFDNVTYQAKLLRDTTNPTTVGIYEKLHADTPATVLLKLLEEEGGYQEASLVWEALKILFDTLEKPSSLYDLAIKEEDLYYGMLLEVLSGVMDEGNDTRIEDSIQFGGDLMDSFKDAFLALYSIDLSKHEAEADIILSNAGKKRVLTEAFDAHYKVPGVASNVMDHLNCAATVLKELQAMEDRTSAAILLQSVSDSYATVLYQMKAECENNPALQKAITNCLKQIEATEAEMMEQLKNGTLKSVGVASGRLIFDKYWKDMMDRVKISHPTAAMVFAAYHGGTTVSNLLGATDASREEYYKLVALQDIKAAVRAAHDSISAGWEGDPAAYLASVQMLFHIQLMDCDHAINYVDIADDALLSKAIEALGGTGFDRAEEAFKTYRNTVQVEYETSQIMWIDYVEADYPGVLLEDCYEEAFALVLKVSRETLFACPVDIYIMDGDEKIGYVTGDDVNAFVEDITVMLDGDQKTVCLLEGANYTFKVVGTGEGAMNVTDVRYENGEPSRTLEYNDLPVTKAGTYTVSKFDNLQDADGTKISAHSDSADTPEYTLTMISGRADVTLARAGQNISIMAVVPEGYTFAGWVCDNTDATIADMNAPVTSIRMPDGDVTVTAQLRVAEESIPDDRLTITNEEGLILREIPKDVFTLRVSGDSIRLLAVYNRNGQMLSVQMATGSDGLLTAALDNTGGEIGRIALFRVESLTNPVPTEKAIEITAE